MSSIHTWRQAVKRMLPLLAFLVALSSVNLEAQANSDSVRLRNDCRLAAQVIQTGQPAPKLEWAWQILGACPGEAGPTAALALQRLRTATDTTDFAGVLAVGFNVRDGVLFEAALKVAGDPGASPMARVESLVVLVYQLSDSLDMTYADIAKADTVSGCPLSWDMDRGRPMPGAPLPADARALAGAATGAIKNDPRSPVVVRIASDCVSEALRGSSP